MVCCSIWLYTIIAIVAALIYFHKKKAAKKLEDYRQKHRAKFDGLDDAEIRDFDPASVLTGDDFEELKKRLNNRIIDDFLDDSDNNPYGTPNFYVNEVADYICQKFDYKNVINVLSQFQHYKTVIGDVDLHFVHMKGDPSKSVPILLLCGFPSSIWEFHKSLPMLVKAGYTVVCPSMPAHGFTAPPRKPGVSPAVIACTYHKLMVRLGYSKYVIHGGDWGSLIGHIQTFLFPEHVAGFQLTLNIASMFSWRTALTVLIGAWFPSLVYVNKRQQNNFHPLSKYQSKQFRAMAYFHIQAVIPDAYGYGMLDSPVGLIGWHGATYAMVTGKRDTALGDTNIRSGIMRSGLDKFGIDNVASQVFIFWCMKTAQASMRIYYEFYEHDSGTFGAIAHPDVPTAVTNFANEMIHLTEFITKGTFNNLKMFTFHEDGGHFAHIDETEAAVGDIVKFMEVLGY